MIICDNCNKDFKNKAALTSHAKNCLSKETINLIIEDYRFNNFSISDISKKYKVNKNRFLTSLKPYIRSYSDANKITNIKYPDKNKHTEDTKQKLREKRLKWMKENPDKTAWRQSNMSYPEKLFLDKIKELELDKKYLIIRERSIYPYFIDFAFENQKIAIEIDGSQHNNPDRKESDKRKDDLLTSMGWSVLRFSANKIKFEIDDCINIINGFLSSVDSEIIGVFSYKEYKSTKKSNSIKPNKNGPKKKIKKISDKVSKKKVYFCESCQIEVSYKSKKCNNCSNIDRSTSQRKAPRPPYNQLIFEVSELGYVKTGKKYGVSDNSIRKWIRMYEKHGENY